jgi:hypothetical protein
MILRSTTFSPRDRRRADAGYQRNPKLYRRRKTAAVASTLTVNRFVFSLLPLLMTTLTATASTTLTYADLTQHLWNPETVAILPQPGEKGAEFSSYDRASRLNPDTGHYENWGANEDQMGVLRMEGADSVFAEMKGPGCIWRIWSAAPGDGQVKVIIDGKPAIDLPFKSYFDGKTAPFNRPNLVYTASRGENNYTPIPYQHSCKIIASPNWGGFYQFSYTTFPHGTTVPSFSMDGVDNTALDEANAAFGARGEVPKATVTDKTFFQGVTLAPGNSVVVANMDGPRAITSFTAKIANLPAAPADQKLLRDLAIKITWDDDAQPAVWAPFGDFFGTAPGANKFQSLMSGLKADGTWYSYWYMPFAKSAKVEFVNESDAPVHVDFNLTTTKLSRPIADYGRFHAKWHRDAFLPDDLDRTIDWTVLKTEGRGRYCGTMLHIWSKDVGWWGEGDEKFFVDGEKFPSSFGTGSEDYFGYAWCDPDLFDQAMHGQSKAQKDNNGHTSVHRWQLADNVPFEKSFDGSIEKYFANTRPTLYAATAYWYLAPGGKDDYKPVPVADRDNYWNDPKTAIQWPAGWDGVDASSMEVRASNGGRHGPYITDEFATDWPANLDRHVALWIGGKPGDTIEYKVHWLRWPAGKYAFSLHFLKRPDGGIVQVYWNGAKVGDPVDLYAPTVTPFDFDLNTAGAVTQGGIQALKFEITGKNPAAKPGNSTALESVRFKAM